MVGEIAQIIFEQDGREAEKRKKKSSFILSVFVGGKHSLKLEAIY